MIMLIWQVRKADDAKYIDMLGKTVTSLHELYKEEKLLKTRDDCDLYAVRLLDIMSGLAHIHLQGKIKSSVLEFLNYDFSVSMRLMNWYDLHRLGDKYNASAGEIWSNLTKYFNQHPEITIASIDVLPPALLNFNRLEMLVFAYGTLADNFTRAGIIKRQIESEADSLIGYELSNIMIENITYQAIVKNDTKTSIDGVKFYATAEDVNLLDEYETNAYDRIILTLQSGDKAWVYVKPE